MATTSSSRTWETPRARWVHRHRVAALGAILALTSLAVLAPSAAANTVINGCTIVSNPTPALHTVCPGVNLSGKNLPSADLRYAELTGANLSKIKLGLANLSGANLTDVNLTAAKLSSANLSNAILVGADLTGADLTKSNLTGADLTNANLTKAKTSFAKLFGTNLTNVLINSVG